MKFLARYQSVTFVKISKRTNIEYIRKVPPSQHPALLDSLPHDGSCHREIFSSLQVVFVYFGRRMNCVACELCKLNFLLFENFCPEESHFSTRVVRFCHVQPGQFVGKLISLTQEHVWNFKQHFLFHKHCTSNLFGFCVLSKNVCATKKSKLAKVLNKVLWNYIFHVFPFNSI